MFENDYEAFKAGDDTKYSTVFEVLSEPDYRIVQLEVVTLNDINELELLKQKELEYIHEYDCVNKSCIDIEKKYKQRVRSKIHYDANKNYYKNYYQGEKQNTKVMCECGKQYLYRSKARHIRTKHHINHFENLQK
jgi:hypothetical protein